MLKHSAGVKQTWKNTVFSGLWSYSLARVSQVHFVDVIPVLRRGARALFKFSSCNCALQNSFQRLAWPWCSSSSDSSICAFLVPGLSHLYSVTGPQNKVFWVLNAHPQLCSESSSSPFSLSKDNWMLAKGTLCILCAREQRICEVATSGTNSNGAGEATVWCGL